jgi:hypothetical protein
MKSYKDQLKEKWVEYTRNIAGNVEDPSFHPSQKKNKKRNTEIMLKKLNDIFMRRKLNEDLRDWLKEKWVDISKKDASGKHPPCGRSKSKKKGYPKCRPSVRVSSKTPETTGEMTKEKKKKAVIQKRRAERKKRKGKKPHMVSHLKESKNVPTNRKLWSRAVSLAKKKFKVYPSAYANLWASKWYKKQGGTWN